MEVNAAHSGLASFLVILGILCVSIFTMAYCFELEDEENTRENYDRVEWSSYLKNKEDDSEKEV